MNKTRKNKVHKQRNNSQNSRDFNKTMTKLHTKYGKAWRQ